MPSFAGIQKFFGRTVSEGAAFAAGVAVAPALEPVVREVVNEAWSQYQTMPLSPGDWAEIVAEDVEQLSQGEDEAKKHGVKPADFDALVQAVLNAPGVPELLTLWRRGFIDDATFEHGLHKTKLEDRWTAPLMQLKGVPLPPAVAALAAVRGLIDAEGTLPVAPPSGVGKVPAFPVYPISGKAAAAAVGLSEDEYGVMVGINGRPMSLHEAASAYFRSIIELDDYYRAVSEGDTRNEWRDAILEQARQILTSHDYVEDHLRGWSDAAAMYAGAAKHGMAQEDVDILFRIAGRPLSWHQVFIGLRRGGVYDGPTTDLDPAFLKALQESNIRPEWYNLAWAQRFSYPTAFVLRTLTQSGDLTEAQTEQILLFEGWEPKLAATVAAKWAETSPAKQDPAVKSAETKFITAIHKAAVGGAITEAQAAEQLALTTLSTTAQAGVLAYFMKEKALGQIPPPPATTA